MPRLNYPIAEKLGLTSTKLCSPGRLWDNAWDDFVEALTSSVEALRNGSTNAPMVSHVTCRNSKVSQHLFTVGYGKINDWFTPPLTVFSAQQPGYRSQAID